MNPPMKLLCPDMGNAPKITCHEPQQPVKKFIDVTKLFQLLNHSTIFFPCLEAYQQDDPYESALWPRQRNAELTDNEALKSKALELQHNLPRQELYDHQGELLLRFKAWVDTASQPDLLAVIDDLEKKHYRRRVVCSCWHLSEYESDAMWKIYAGRTGVAITSTVEQVCGAIQSCPQREYGVADSEFVIARVRYLEPTEVDGLQPQNPKDSLCIHYPWLLKRKAFAHESELRVFTVMPSAVLGTNVTVAPSKLIKEIVLSPFNSAWVNDALRTTIEILLKNSGLSSNIKVSEHMARPEEQNPFLQHNSFENRMQNMHFLMRNGLLR